ncbi:MAG: hypothetical protein IPK76_26500 [Lewinellaceae bacterium]|nr:hypothetical protein [Lewinellaceae bacterium]
MKIQLVIDTVLILKNEVSILDAWKPEDILERGLKLLNFMENRWEINLGSKSEKIKLLSLDFLKVKRPVTKATSPMPTKRRHGV